MPIHILYMIIFFFAGIWQAINVPVPYQRWNIALLFGNKMNDLPP